MIIFGWNEVLSNNFIIPDARLCARCNNVVQWHFAKLTSWFTLFFIPLIPYSSRYLYMCPVCSNSYDLTQAQFFEISRQSNMTSLQRPDIHHKPSRCILLIIITAGIYFFILMHRVAKNVNTIASPHDGKQTMNVFLCCWLIAYIIRIIASQVLFHMAITNSAITSLLLVVACMIPLYIWLFKLTSRMGNELKRRGIAYSFDTKDFWLYFVLGIFILVGPFIYIYKIVIASTKLAEHYNCGNKTTN